MNAVSGHARAMAGGANCSSCPFHSPDAPPVFPEGSRQAETVICGESPGHTEVRHGRPFVGESGELLNRILAACNISRSKQWITNAVLCRPQSKDNASWKKALDCCRPRLENELKQLRTRTVLAFGGYALQQLTRRRGIFDWCGAPLEGRAPFEKHTIFATLHPAFILRPDGRPQTPLFAAHVMRAFLHARGELPEWRWPTMYLEPGPEVVRELRRILREKRPIGFDVETRGKNPLTAPLMSVGLSDGRVMISLPWERYVAKGGQLVEPIEVYKTGPLIKKLVQQIMEDESIEKVLQNGQHDLLSCERLGWKPAGYAFDDLLAHAVVRVGARHDLGIMAAEEMAADRWKSYFHVTSDAKGLDSFVKRDPLELREYNAKDAAATLLLRKPLERRLAASNNAQAVFEGHLRRAKIALMMRRRGVKVDVTKFVRHRRRILRHRLKHKRALFEIAAGFGWQTPPVDDPRWRMFSKQITRYRWIAQRCSLLIEQRPDDFKVPHWKRVRHKARKKRRSAEDSRAALVKDAGRIFNPNSKRCLNKLFFEQLHVQARTFSRKTNSPKLNEDLLTNLVTHPSAIVALAARSLLAYRRWTKLLSTYIDGMPMDANHVVHPTWNVAGARTQRWSAQDPNVMNIPKPEVRLLKDGRKKYGKSLRDLFVPHAQNGWVVEADYSQLELRIIAQLSGDEPLVRAYQEGQDVHTINAMMLFGISDAKLVLKSQRNLAKVFAYAANYLGTAETIWKSIVAEGFTEVTLLQVERMLQRWFNLHPAIRRWQNSAIAAARKNDYTETPIQGHRTILYGNVDPKKVVNTPVQSMAAEIINPRLEKVAARLNWRDEGIMFQYHDALICDGADPVRLAGILKEELTARIEVGGVWMDYPVDIKLGRDWGSAVEVKKLEEIPDLMRRLAA